MKTLRFATLCCLAYAAIFAAMVTVSWQPPAINLCPEAQAITTGETGYSVTTDGSTPVTASARLWRPIGYDPASGSAELRTQVWLDPAGYATWTEIKASAPSLVPGVLNEIQAIRRQALSQAVANAGVAEVYALNYEAALAYQAGEGDITILKSGMTATAHLAGFAPYLGMTASQFAAWIIAENERLGPSAYAVEQEYLRLTYAVIPQEADVQRLLAYPAAYKSFCGL